MNPFQRLPNEIIDAIFIHLRPDEVWTTQQCSASTERALDPHLRTRRYAVDYLMLWACSDGNNQAVRKAVSLGADVSVARDLPGARSDSKRSTIHRARYNPDTVRLLLDLGARLDIDSKDASEDRRRCLERDLSPEVYQMFSDRGMTDQFIDFQDCIDHCLYQEINGWWYEEGEGPDIEKNISMLLELGASSVTLIQSPEGSIGTTLSYAVKCMHDWYYYQPAPWCLPILKLLLSKRPDVNAPSLEVTKRFLRDPDVLMWWEANVCPIAAAVWCMVVLGTTEVMDLLLEAGAKLDLPVLACFQPLAVYAYSIEFHEEDPIEARDTHSTETHGGRGFEYLISHGASFEPVYHLGEHGHGRSSTPIFLLCKNWYNSQDLDDINLLLDDDKFGIIKLFIAGGAVKKVGLRFIKNILRPITDEEIDDDENPDVIERSHILLKLILQDDNLDPNNPGEIHELISEIVDQAFASAPGSGQFLYFSHIIDPILVALLLQKGASLRTRRLTKEVRDYVVSELQRDPYNIRIDT